MASGAPARGDQANRCSFEERMSRVLGCLVMRPESRRLNPAALRAARLRAGLTQHQLARLVGVAGGERVSRWELGTSAPRPEVLRRFASVLNVELAELLESVDEVPDLRGLRRRVGLSLGELAMRVHVSKATLSRWESGQVRRTPDKTALTLLAESLGVLMDEVVLAFVRGRNRP